MGFSAEPGWDRVMVGRAEQPVWMEERCLEGPLAGWSKGGKEGRQWPENGDL